MLYEFGNGNVFDSNELKQKIDSEPQFIESNGGIKKIKCHILLKNFGEIPAFDTRGREKLVIGNEPTEKDLKNIEYGFPFELMPGGEQKYIFTLNDGPLEPKEDERIFLIFEIKYYSADSDSRKLYGYIIEFRGYDYVKIRSWNEKKTYSYDETKN